MQATVTAHCTPSPSAIIQPVVGLFLLLYYSQAQAFASCAATPQLMQPVADLHLLRYYSRLQALTTCTGTARCRPLPTSLKSHANLLFFNVAPLWVRIQYSFLRPRIRRLCSTLCFHLLLGPGSRWLCTGVHLVLSASVPQTPHTKFNLKMS